MKVTKSDENKNIEISLARDKGKQEISCFPDKLGTSNGIHIGSARPGWLSRFMLLKKTFFQSPGKSVVTGFVAIVTLMLVVSVLGMIHMRSLKHELDSIVENHFEKGRLIGAMRVAARERTLSLYRIIHLEDPFERDDEWIRFNARAAMFTGARTELMLLPLSDEEKTVLEFQGRFTSVAVPLQNRVVDLALADRYEAAEMALEKEAIPAQNQVLGQLDLLSEIQLRSANAAVGEMGAQYRTTRITMITLILIFLLISISVAAYIDRRLREDRRSLHGEKEKAQVTLRSIGDAVITTDADGNIETLNNIAERLAGCSEEELRGSSIDEALPFLHDSTRLPSECLVSRALSENTIVTSSSSLVLSSRSGIEYAIEATASPIRDDVNTIFGAVLVFRDVTEVRAMSRELAYQARHDVLTNLFNRREFEERLTEYFGMAKKGKTGHVLCYLDLDNFKVVNDTCGHAAGDALLKRLAKLLRRNLRREDILARLGGDEFGVIIVDSGIDDARQVATKLHNVIKDFHFYWEGNIFEIGASIGLVEIGMDARSIYDLLRAADFACYAAKDMGRNQIQVYSPDDLVMARRQGELEWVQHINHALEQDRLVLYCQDITPLDAPGKVKYEFLVRMRGVDGGIVEPSSFLPAAEHYNLIVSIDRWVIDHGFRIVCALEPQQLKEIDCFNINLSGQSVGDPAILDYIVKRFELYEVAPEKICFEITETAAIANLGSARNMMTILKAMGCRFALDDFGSGLSSFGYLRSLPIDLVKIDGAFVRNMVSDETDLAMVISINQVAHAIGIKTVAEYVENREILLRAKEVGIDYGQGIHIAKPREAIADELGAPVVPIAWNPSILN